MRSLKIILLASAFNGLTQRAWLELREAGHVPSVVLFSDAEAVCHAGAIVLDDRVGLDGEATHDIAAVLLLEIDHDAALVAVEVEEGGGHAALERAAEEAGRIALGWFDFDHVGAEVTEHHRAKRSRHNLGEIQDAKPNEWSFCHCVLPRARNWSAPGLPP